MIKDLNSIRRAALMGSAATLIAGFAMGVGVTTAAAQDADDADEVEEVIVTGSRIKNPNISSPSPVTSVDAEAITMRGTTQIEDMLTTLPQTVAATGDGDFAGDGTAKVDLRGLGPNRTLVLVDGRRLPYGQSNATAADLNSIPSALVKRVEVLTGGASAVYGADAVAGVVNFVMNKDFEGMQVSGQMSINQADNDSKRYAGILATLDQDPPPSTFDGFTWSTDVLVGANTDDGRGNVTIAFNYRNANAIQQKDRDYAACAFGGGGAGSEYGCVGSSNTFPAKIFDGNYNLTRSEGSDTLRNAYNLLAYDKVTGQTRDYNGATDTFNFAITQRTRAPSERFGISAFSHYEVAEWAELYLNMAYTSNNSIGQIGPSANFGVTSELNCGNPFFSAKMVEEICTLNGYSVADNDIVYGRVARRNVEGGGRQYWNSNDTFRINGGVRGDLSENWSYDLFGQFSRVKNNLIFKNGLDRIRMQRALLIVNDPDTGNPACMSAVDGSDPKCVPWNVFQPGGVTQEALDYITIPTLEIGSVNQKYVSFNVTGDLTEYGFVMPGATTGVQFVGGLEHRQDELFIQYDQTQLDASTTLRNRQEGVKVSEFFGELAVPIIEGSEMAEEVTATGAFRWSDYDTTGVSNTWALGLTWTPNSNIKFRGQMQQAVRAPNVFELYNSVSYGLFDLTDPDGDGIYDPCAGATPQYTQAQCELQGIPASLYGLVGDQPAGQFNMKTGGNPNLDVETSRTYTIGAIITPETIPGLTVSADYYDITVDDFVGTIPPQLTLEKCSLEADPFYCSLINRDSGGGLYIDEQTSHVIATNLNTGSLKTKGIDFNLSYGFDMPDGYGSMNITSVVNYLFKYQIKPIPGSEDNFQCAGFYSGSCDLPRSKRGATTTATWTTDGGTDVSLTWRHIGGTTLHGATDQTSQNYTLEDINYFDIAASFNVAENVRMRAGINNVLGQRPATTAAVPAGLGTGNTFPGLYDADMRLLFVAFTADF